MDFKKLIKTILAENLTPDAYTFWINLDQKKIPDIWEKPSSSTGKHHLKDNSYVPTQSEHIYEMLYTAVKLLKMFQIQPKTENCDTILLGIVLHDSLKYGKNGQNIHTDRKHDRLAAEMIKKNRTFFSKILPNNIDCLIESIRYHAGVFSSDRDTYDINKINKISFFIHILDMLSCYDLIKLPKKSLIEENQ